MHVIMIDTRITLIDFLGLVWNGSARPFRNGPSFAKHAGM